MIVVAISASLHAVWPQLPKVPGVLCDTAILLRRDYDKLKASHYSFRGSIIVVDKVEIAAEWLCNMANSSDYDVMLSPTHIMEQYHEWRLNDGVSNNNKYRP